MQDSIHPPRDLEQYPYLIGYYVSHAKTARNQGIVVVYDFLSWEEAVLKNRGLLGGRRLYRPAFPHEVEVIVGAKRRYSVKYHSLTALIDDERRAGCDEAMIEQIRNALFDGARPEELTHACAHQR